MNDDQTVFADRVLGRVLRVVAADDVEHHFIRRVRLELGEYKAASMRLTNTDETTTKTKEMGCRNTQDPASTKKARCRAGLVVRKELLLPTE